MPSPAWSATSAWRLRFGSCATPTGLMTRCRPHSSPPGATCAIGLVPAPISAAACAATFGNIDTIYVVDVNGKNTVIVARHYPGTSAADVAELQSIVNSRPDRALSSGPATSTETGRGGRALAATPCHSPARRARIIQPTHLRRFLVMGDKGPGSKGGGKKPKTSTKKKGAADASTNLRVWLNSGRRLVGRRPGVRLDDRVATEDERLANLVRVGAFVPLRETRVVVVGVVALVVLEYARDQVLD